MNPPYFCDCMRRTVIKTSWTDANPGRRFRACPIVGENGCGFFQWMDPPMCARSREIIPGLLMRLNRGDIELAKYKKFAQMLVFLLVIVIAVMFFMSFGEDVSVGDGDCNKNGM